MYPHKAYITGLYYWTCIFVHSRLMPIELHAALDQWTWIGVLDDCKNKSDIPYPKRSV